MIKKIILKKLRDRETRPGHPWIYRSQIKDSDGRPTDGDIVEIYSSENRFLGIGYFNSHSEITVRLLTHQKEAIDKAFFVRRLTRALDFRKKMVKDTNAYRILSSEADDLPGLILDRYGEVLVVQFLTMGMERLKPIILEAVEEAIPSKGIYERSDSGSRRLEGLKESVGWLRRDCGDDVIIHERNIEFLLKFGDGHKTGFYLDQRENRFLLADLFTKGRVLDAFCYVGSFGLHLAAAGCHVLGLDIQKEAIARAEENQKLNHIPTDKLQFKEANVFDELRALEKSSERFDLVILDPPSFVKRKDGLEGALSGYKEINLRAMKLLNPGGCLALFSCSYHVDENLLMQSALSAAWDAHKHLKVLKFLKQSADHPINPFIPETYYLKGFLFEVS